MGTSERDRVKKSGIKQKQGDQTLLVTMSQSSTQNIKKIKHPLFLLNPLFCESSFLWKMSNSLFFANFWRLHHSLNKVCVCLFVCLFVLCVCLFIFFVCLLLKEGPNVNLLPELFCGFKQLVNSETKILATLQYFDEKITFDDKAI